MDFLTTPTALTALSLEIATPPAPEKPNIPSKMLHRDVEADDGADEQLAKARAALEGKAGASPAKDESPAKLSKQDTASPAKLGRQGSTVAK